MIVDEARSVMGAFVWFVDTFDNKNLCAVRKRDARRKREKRGSSSIDTVHGGTKILREV